ncbi:Plasmodium variant antigen protein Cir/Yir/Bir, putative [Plasmodium chabaudi adami]|uniref:Plasmodium variant antigen protein Cir/Yir/Bir, putative n=1 Tax=Plasmodium chabaudi adami TaxID=5826 RepID=A0A1D3LAI1_PLACE|nr:Plasmodium variant antigen protein Cir/Yir/Bir, putative [Plasmodium chabaudi adami]
MSKELCVAINEIDKLFRVEKNDSGSFIKYDDSLKAYCPIPKNVDNQECAYYEKVVASAFIALLTLFKNVDYDEEENVLEDDKLAEYAILWLCYKINQETHTFRNLNEFYNKHLINTEKYVKEENGAEAYKSYKDIINKKHDLMNMDIQIISKFYEALQILCNMHNEGKEKNTDCAKCSQKANEFVKSFKELNDDSNHIEGSSYSQILFTLSNDYDNFKKSCCNGQSKNLPSLPQIKPTKYSAQNYLERPGHTYGQTSEDISSKSPIANTLIPVLSIFAVPIFLGIAYKYSLFGFDKRLHRKYLREKVKKIKNKMNHYI